jgi:uncharacterized protein (DUF433 family)
MRYLSRVVTSPLPPVRVPHPHVAIDPDGSPIVEGTRVPVRRLFGWHRQGTTVETLLRRYPQLGPARIFDALAFAYDNLELMTADLLREREVLAKENESAQPPPASPKERAVEAAKNQGTLPFKR